MLGTFLVNNFTPLLRAARWRPSQATAHHRSYTQGFSYCWKRPARDYAHVLPSIIICVRRCILTPHPTHHTPHPTPHTPTRHINWAVALQPRVAAVAADADILGLVVAGLPEPYVRIPIRRTSGFIFDEYAEMRHESYHGVWPCDGFAGDSG